MFNLMREMRGLDVAELAALLQAKVAELDEETPPQGHPRASCSSAEPSSGSCDSRAHNQFLEGQADTESSYASYINRQLKDPFEVERISAASRRGTKTSSRMNATFGTIATASGTCCYSLAASIKATVRCPTTRKYPHYVEQNSTGEDTA